MPAALVTRLRVASPLCATLVVSLALAQWPEGEGDVTGRDREVVARLTRGGVQRLEDAVHVDHDAFDATVSHRPDGTAAPASAALVAASVTALVAPMATQWSAAPTRVAWLTATAAALPLGRAPPTR